MKILISTQNYLSSKGGISKFIRKYSSPLNDTVYFITRENIKRPYMLNEVEIKDIKKKIEEIKPDIIHLHSVLDSTLYNGLVDTSKSLKIPTIYFCHSFLKEEIENETLTLEKFIPVLREGVKITKFSSALMIFCLTNFVKQPKITEDTLNDPDDPNIMNFVVLGRKLIELAFIFIGKRALLKKTPIKS